MLAELKSKAQGLRQDHALRSLLMQCRRLLSERGEANGPAIALSIVERIDALADDRRSRFFDHLARDFSPDPRAVLASAQAYAKNPGAEQLMHLTHATEPPRQELFRRLNRTAGGTAAIVRLRRALLERLPKNPQLQAVEADLLHLLSSWFNAGFLQMRRVDWNSPAQLLEQIIRHEAVHEIDGWDDLRRRLQPDRRCFAFFHPQLPDEPLIFVEVALVGEMAGAIAPLIDKKSRGAGQRPLQGGRVLLDQQLPAGPAQRLARQLSDQARGRRTQARAAAAEDLLHAVADTDAGAVAGAPAAPGGLPGLKPQQAERALQSLALLRKTCGDDLAGLTHATTLHALPTAAHQALWRLAALYLVLVSPTPQGDPVARFHLDNGARLERLNASANLSAKGLKQSAGLMVNYLYDLSRIETCHDRFVHGRVVHSRALSALL